MTAFSDLKLFPLHRHEDARGFFCESFRLSWLQDDPSAAPLVAAGFVQTNLSRSKKHVLRGLHFQRREPQGKLVQVLQGTVFDVVVNVRQHCPSFGRWTGFTLAADQPQALWIPPGYAHGFVALTDDVLISYQCTQYFDAPSEVCLRWNDADLAIDWPVKNPTVSARDARGLSLRRLRDMGLCL